MNDTGVCLMARGTTFVIVGGLVASALSSCAVDEETVTEDFTSAEMEKIKTLGPLPEMAPADPTNKYADLPEYAKFGQRLFFERTYAGPIEVDGPSGMVKELGK